ncbi:hypothetical protein BJ170DRAFT_236080 [Xylariales sp. AK1849]|nr:hypothetical protein BJ170DRAFT_236080 [Xylariales sp. AK1849]
MREETIEHIIAWKKTSQRGQDRVRKHLKIRPNPSGVDPLTECTAPPRDPQWHLKPRGAPGSTPPSPSQLPAFLDEVPSAARRGYGLRSMDRRFSFLQFPAEIRNMIYRYAAVYPTSRQLFDSYYVQTNWATEDELKGILPLNPILISNGNIQLHTPTIYLLCKQITKEALGVLRNRVFVVDHIPAWIMGHQFPLPIACFIPKQTLQSIRFLELRISLGEGSGSGRVWHKLIDDLLRCLTNHSLVRFKVLFKFKNMDNSYVWSDEFDLWEGLIDKANFRKWEIDNAKTGGFVEYETWIIEEICHIRWAYKHSEEYRNPLICKWPNDPSIWGSTILSFV